MVGPPGVGKTRLAAEVAGRVASQFAAGVVSVSLATVTAGEDAAAAIAAALRVRQGPGTGLADALVAATRGEHRLLLLEDRKSTRLNSSHVAISYAVFCLKKKKKRRNMTRGQRRRRAAT